MKTALAIFIIVFPIITTIPMALIMHDSWCPLFYSLGYFLGFVASGIVLKIARS